MVKAIITDLGNVLVKFDHMIACRKLAVLTLNGKHTARDIYEKVIRDPIIVKYEKGLITSLDFYCHLVESLQLRVNYETFRKAWAEIFEASPGMEEIIIKLKSQIPLFLISNTNEIHFQYVFSEFPLLQHLEDYILSYQVGYTKPEKEIYQEVLKRHGLEANQCLYIDDIKTYIQAASALGFHSIHFREPEQLRQELSFFGFSS